MARADPDPPTARYRAFISYSHADDEVARWLHRALERFVIPKELRTGALSGQRRLYPVFRDREELAATANLSAGIVEALRLSETLIVVCSPAAARSTWVDHEIRQFRALHPDRPVLALLAGGEPNARSEDRECLPPALRAGAAGIEPIAADIRPGGDGRRMARLKLAAGMLGVGLDDLARRAQARRQRLLLAAAAGALLVIAALSVALAFALRARAEAVRQRGEAEGLIEFMIGDFRKKLEPTGKLGLMDAVGDRALAYYRAQDESSLDADSLGRRARVLHLVGEIQDQRGRLDLALANFEAAAASTAKLVAREPENGQRIFDHAQSVFWVGKVHWERGQLAEAQRANELYRVLAEKLIRIDPDNDTWRAEVGYAASNLGSVQLKLGLYSEAEASFRRALDVSRELQAKSPDDRAAMLDLGQSYAWLADAQERMGKRDEATANRSKEAAIYRSELERDPSNAKAKEWLCNAERALAGLALDSHRLTDARVHSENAVRLADQLLQIDATNVDWLAKAQMAYVLQGETQIRLGLAGQAYKSWQKSHSLSTILVRRDPSIVQWHMSRARSDLLRSTIALSVGNKEQAAYWAQLSMNRIVNFDPKGQDSLYAQFVISRARLILNLTSK